MARESGRSVHSVASDSYALTLWTYYQFEEADYMESLIREHEDLRMADMIATAFHEPKKLRLREADWRRRAFAPDPVDELTIEKISQHADDLWERHERSRKGLVS